MFVGLDHFFQVLVIDRFLIGGILLSKALFQNFGRGLQVNDEVGNGKLIAEMIVVAVIGIEFLIGQIEAGEKLVFFEDKIGGYDFFWTRAEVEGKEVVEAAGEKNKLRLGSG